MRLSSIATENDFSRLRELAPTMGAGTTPAAAFAAPSSSPAPGVAQATQDPQANAKMLAQQALDRANQKKQIQNQISATQKQLQDLQKQLAALR